ncbi:MAG TPA: Gfo/Idh/MocA family oxidoreductase [Kineosporiaceae bacterium]|nr:Gfo/Idh/MocA family oxidoreductase [Kineosporiaceae bacterium]
MTELTVVLAGVHGHGWWHLRNLRRLQALGRVRLVGVCDLVPAAPELLEGFDGLVQSSSLTEVLDRTKPDIVVIATPIHTHAELALVAARAGVHILLEKPPAPTLAAYQRIVDGVSAAGVACQVGFQSLGSGAVTRAADLVRSGEIGAVRGISAAGAWHRDSTYYDRARWAGHRTLDGVDVVDGALTNPFAHALATALQVDGSASDDLGSEVELELWHAYDIDSDDTSCLRLVTSRGTTITVAVTLCAPDREEPYLVLHGERGRAVLWYTRDVLEIEHTATPEQPVRSSSAVVGDAVVADERVDLLENLVAHLADRDVPLLVPLSATLAFMHAVEAVRLAPAPRPIPKRFLEISAVPNAGVDAESRIVPGVVKLVMASADRLALFSELDVEWAQPSEPGSNPETVSTRGTE